MTAASRAGDNAGMSRKADNARLSREGVDAAGPDEMACSGEGGGGQAQRAHLMVRERAAQATTQS